MRVLILRTWSTSCDPICQSLRSVGADTEEISYNLREIDQAGLPAFVASRNPDWVLFIGTSDHGGEIVPSRDALRLIASERPLVHLCCDGSEEDWYPQLDWYVAHGGFALSVNIDGVALGPMAHGGRCWTTLCPIDPAPFRPLPWGERSVPLGFCGGWGPGHPRKDIVEDLAGRGLLTAVKRPFTNYAGYRDFLCSCRGVWNSALTGSAVRRHVKARVVEAGLAGAILFEEEAAPTRDYFTPGEDYLQWGSVDDVVRGLEWMRESPESARAMAARMRSRVISQYAAKPFWNEGFRRAGL